MHQCSSFKQEQRPHSSFKRCILFCSVFLSWIFQTCLYELFTFASNAQYIIFKQAFHYKFAVSHFSNMELILTDVKQTEPLVWIYPLNVISRVSLCSDESVASV